MYFRVGIVIGLFISSASGDLITKNVTATTNHRIVFHGSPAFNNPILGNNVASLPNVLASSNGRLSFDTSNGDATHDGYSFTFAPGTVTRSWEIFTGLNTTTTVTATINVDPISVQLSPSPVFRTGTSFTASTVGYDELVGSNFIATPVTGSYTIVDSNSTLAAGTFSIPRQLKQSHTVIREIAITRDSGGVVIDISASGPLDFAGNSTFSILDDTVHGHPFGISYQPLSISLSTTTIPEPSSFVFLLILSVGFASKLHSHSHHRPISLQRESTKRLLGRNWKANLMNNQSNCLDVF